MRRTSSHAEGASHSPQPISRRRLGCAAARSIVDYLRPILEARREDPRDDLPTALMTAEMEGEKLTEEDLLSFLRLLIPVGAETTYRLTGNVLFALLTHPEAHKNDHVSFGLGNRLPVLFGESPARHRVLAFRPTRCENLVLISRG